MLRVGGSACALADAYPVADGHALVVPRRHVADLRELRIREAVDLWHLVHALACATDNPGLTIGANVGACAGQTVPHAHVHLIPRSPGDVPDPRGGVRWVVPARAAYWAE